MNKELKNKSIDDSGNKNSDPKNQSVNLEDDTSLKTDNKEYILSLQETILKAEKKAHDQERARIIEQEKRRELELRLSSMQQEKSQRNDDYYSNDGSDDDTPPAWFIKQQQKTQAENKETALRQFIINHPKIQSENDYNDENYNKFIAEVNKYGLKGVSNGDIIEELEGFYRKAGLSDDNQQNKEDQSRESLVHDSGIGDTTPSVRKVNKEPDILTRPLTDDEKNAVEIWAEGKNITLIEAEKAYRRKGANSQKL